jgi:NADH dehydrogenase
VGSLSGVSKKKVFVKGFLAGVMYAALYQKHLMAVSGLRRALLAVVAQGLGRVLSPRVKLH